MVTRQAVGRIGEDAAALYLQRAGLRILERNAHFRAGEIDVIAEDGGELVFVEVRTRRGANFGAPEESITRMKAQHMEACALTYLALHAAEARSWRIDLIAVELHRGLVRRLEHYKHVLG